jgi:tetratricopeptide (TPR) repeat protein
MALRFVREHPRKFLALTAKRAVLFWGPDEVANNKSVRTDKAESRTLRRLPGFPGVLSLSLAGAGALLLRERRRRGRGRARDAVAEAPPDPAARFAWIGLALFVLAYFLSFVPFLAAARFRAPIIPVVFVFGAWGIVELARALRRGAWGAAGLAIAAWAALFVACRHSFYPSAFDEAWWHTDRAAALLRTNRADEAVRELEAALRANPGYVDAQVTLAGILEQQGKADEAIARYRDVLAHRPHRQDLRLRYASLLLGAGRFEEAIPELRTIVKASPMSAPAQFQLGSALLKTGRDDEGLGALRLSLQIDPNQPAARINTGIALARRTDHAGAVDEFTKALQLDPSSGDAHRERARSLMALGRSADAERDWLEMARLRPQDVRSPLLVGDFYFAQKRWSEAASWYERAIGVDARSMMARVNYASALTNGGKYLEAVHALEAAEAIDPNDPAVQERLRVLRDYLARPPAPAAPKR